MSKKIKINKFLSDKKLDKIEKICKDGSDVEYNYTRIENVMSDNFKVKDLGTNRIIFINKDENYKKYVFKIAGDEHGIDANYREFRNGDLSKWLTNSYSISKNGVVLVQERVKPFNSEDMNKYKNDVKDMLKKLSKKILLVDCKISNFKNFGLRKDGSVCLLDHGDTIPLPKYQNIDNMVNLEEEANISLRCKKILNKKAGKKGGQYCGGKLKYDKNFEYLVCEKCKNYSHVSSAYTELCGEKINEYKLIYGKDFKLSDFKKELRKIEEEYAKNQMLNNTTEKDEDEMKNNQIITHGYIIPESVTKHPLYKVYYEKFKSEKIDVKTFMKICNLRNLEKAEPDKSIPPVVAKAIDEYISLKTTKNENVVKHPEKWYDLPHFPEIESDGKNRDIRPILSEYADYIFIKHVRLFNMEKNKYKAILKMGELLNGSNNTLSVQESIFIAKQLKKKEGVVNAYYSAGNNIITVTFSDKYDFKLIETKYPEYKHLVDLDNGVKCEDDDESTIFDDTDSSYGKSVKCNNIDDMIYADIKRDLENESDNQNKIEYCDDELSDEEEDLVENARLFNEINEKLSDIDDDTDCEEKCVVCGSKLIGKEIGTQFCTRCASDDENIDDDYDSLDDDENIDDDYDSLDDDTCDLLDDDDIDVDNSNAIEPTEFSKYIITNATSTKLLSDHVRYTYNINNNKNYSEFIEKFNIPHNKSIPELVQILSEVAPTLTMSANNTTNIDDDTLLDQVYIVNNNPEQEEESIDIVYERWYDPYYMYALFGVELANLAENGNTAKHSIKTIRNFMDCVNNSMNIDIPSVHYDLHDTIAFLIKFAFKFKCVGVYKDYLDIIKNISSNITYNEHTSMDIFYRLTIITFFKILSYIINRIDSDKSLYSTICTMYKDGHEMGINLNHTDDEEIIIKHIKAALGVINVARVHEDVCITHECDLSKISDYDKYFGHYGKFVSTTLHSIIEKRVDESPIEESIDNNKIESDAIEESIDNDKIESDAAEIYDYNECVNIMDEYIYFNIDKEMVSKKAIIKIGTAEIETTMKDIIDAFLKNLNQ